MVKTTLIKPKKVKEKEAKKLEVLGPLLMLIVGIILLTNSSKAVIFVFYCIGVLAILFGVFHLVSYYRTKKELKVDDNAKLVMGSSSVFVGIVIILLAGAIETFLRFILGFVLLFHGVRKTIFSLTQKNYVVLLEGIFLVGIGLYTILAENIVFQVIGVLLIVSSIIDFIEFIKVQKNKA